MKEPEYMPVEVARDQLGLSPREMSILLQAGALRWSKDPHNETIRLVRAVEVRDAVGHLAKYRQEENERIKQLVNSAKDNSKTESRKISFFNLSDTDLMTLLLASVSYFDAERDIYFMHPDDRDHIGKVIKAIEKIYGRLERGSIDGRSLQEIITEIYEQRPDQDARREVFLYLMNKRV